MFWIFRRKKTIGLKKADRSMLIPGRHSATIINEKGIYDRNAIIGYDNILNTHFCQAFEYFNTETGADELKFWLGTSRSQFPLFQDLLDGINKKGYCLLDYDMD